MDREADFQVRASFCFAGEVQLLGRKARDLRECCDTWLTHLCIVKRVKDKTPIYPEGQNLFFFFPQREYRVILLVTPQLSADSRV